MPLNKPNRSRSVFLRQSKKHCTIDARLGHACAERIVWGLTLIFLVALFALCWLQYETGRYGLDLAWQANLVSSGPGKWPMFSTISDSWLGNHFQPIAVFLVPVYWAMPSSWTLIAFQLLLLGAIPWLIYKQALIVTERPWLSLVLSICAMLNPAIWYVATFDFHWEVVSIPLILYYFICISQGRSTRALIGLGLLLLCKEDAGLIAAPLAIAHYIRFNEKRTAASAGITALFVWVLVNACVFRFLHSTPPIGRWRYLGDTFQEVLLSALQHPELVIHRLCTWRSATYLLDLMLPWLFLPILNWRVLLPSVIFIAYCSSDYWKQNTVYYQYSVAIWPCVTVAAIHAIGWLSSLKRVKSHVLGSLLLTTNVVNMFWLAPHQNLVRSDWASHVRTVHYWLSDLTNHDALRMRQDELQRILLAVPPTRSISVACDVNCAYMFTDHFRITIYDRSIRDRSELYKNWDYVVGNQKFGYMRADDEYQEDLKRLLSSRDWEKIYYDNEGYFVLRQLKAVP